MFADSLPSSNAISAASLARTSGTIHFPPTFTLWRAMYFFASLLIIYNFLGLFFALFRQRVKQAAVLAKCQQRACRPFAVCPALAHAEGGFCKGIAQKRLPFFRILTDVPDDAGGFVRYLNFPHILRYP